MKHIGPAFGDARPSLVTMAQLSEFRETIKENVSPREAHRCIKIWRALWNVMVALKYCQGADPSRGFENNAAPARQVFWEFAEVCQLCKRAWREGYHGLTAVIAVAWDTSMSPVDVRSLRPQDRQGAAFILKRAKTRRAGRRHSHTALRAHFVSISGEARDRDRAAGGDLPQPIWRPLFQRHT